MSRFIRVTAPSRLHFGLLSLGGTPGRHFGGVGAMIEQPCVNLRVGSATAFDVAGHGSRRALEFAGKWRAFHGRELPTCRLELLATIPEHAGLGSGTQLALGVAAGLSAFCGLTKQSPQELAMSVGRGLRSAVGTYGFSFGGLIVEQGKLAGEAISPLDCRVDLPVQWRFVLVLPRGLSGLAGSDEATAFSALPPVPQVATDKLVSEIHDSLVPAAATADFDRFAASLYRYGHLSGECFAARQGGPYNGPLLAALVARIRRLGYEGVGQSSWGPTICAACPSQSAAEKLVEQLAAGSEFGVLDHFISAPCNRGAQIEVYGETSAELSAER
jgi:beta-ribofuranosylaminobenzene 5'-phosphate synthase